MLLQRGRLQIFNLYTCAFPSRTNLTACTDAPLKGIHFFWPHFCPSLEVPNAVPSNWWLLFRAVCGLVPAPSSACYPRPRGRQAASASPEAEGPCPGLCTHPAAVHSAFSSVGLGDAPECHPNPGRRCKREQRHHLTFPLLSCSQNDLCDEAEKSLQEPSREAGSPRGEPHSPSQEPTG